MGYNDDWSMDPAEVERVMRGVRRRHLARRRHEIAVALLAWASGTGLVLGLIYYWRAR